MLVRNCISILLDETFRLVSNVQSIVGNRKCRVPESRSLEHILVFGCLELGNKLGEEGLICARGKARFFIEKGENTEFAFDDIDTRLIVAKVDKGPVDLLADVLFLFEFEYMCVELRRVSTSYELAQRRTSCWSFSFA
jgi:hypothetical protein